jgi:hypothetical protein
MTFDPVIKYIFEINRFDDLVVTVCICYTLLEAYSAKIT